MWSRQAVPLLLEVQGENFPEPPGALREAKRFEIALTMWCPLQKKSKCYMIWVRQIGIRSRLPLTTSVPGASYQSDCLLPTRLCWFSLYGVSYLVGKLVWIRHALRMLSMSFLSRTCCFIASPPACRAAFSDSRISTDVS